MKEKEKKGEGEIDFDLFQTDPKLQVMYFTVVMYVQYFFKGPFGFRFIFYR